MATKKLLTSGIMAVLALSILSLNVPALSQDEGNEEEQQGTEEQDGEQQEQAGQEEEAEAGTEVSVEVEGNEIEVEVEVEGGLDGEYEVSLDCGTKPAGLEGPILSGTLIVENGKGEVKLEAELVAGEYADCTLTFGDFSEQVEGFTIMAEEAEEEELAEDKVEEEIKVEAKIVDTSSLVEVKVEFTSANTDKESLLQEILGKIRLDQETVSNVIEIEVEEDEELKEKLEVKVKIEDGKAEVKFEHRFVIESTDRDTIIAAIVDKLQNLELNEDDIELKVKAKDKSEEKRESKARAAKEAEEEIKVKATIVGTSSLAEVKVEFTSSNTDKESLLEEIRAKIKLDEATVSNALKIETEEEELKEKLEAKVKIEDGKAEVEFKHRFLIDSTDRETIIAAIVDKLQKLDLSEDDVELRVKAKGEYKEKATKIAQEAREAAEEDAKPEFVESIEKAERFFGKSEKVVVGLKIGLQSGDIESMSFGSAQLTLIKLGEKETMFRAVINILTDQPVDTLTACLDGQAIGQLTIIPASEELGLSIGHLKETLSGLSITIPGITVDIVEGTDCNVAPMLSGSV